MHFYFASIFSQYEPSYTWRSCNVAAKSLIFAPHYTTMGMTCNIKMWENVCQAVLSIQKWWHNMAITVIRSVIWPFVLREKSSQTCCLSCICGCCSSSLNNLLTAAWCFFSLPLVDLAPITSSKSSNPVLKCWFCFLQRHWFYPIYSSFIGYEEELQMTPHSTFLGHFFVSIFHGWS